MKQRPNFLFLFSDQHRGDWMPYRPDTKEKMGVSDLVLNTPNLRSLMDRGVTFTKAFSPAPICAPARACLASGQRYKKCRVFTNQVNYDCNLKTFYTQLKENGYYVCGVGKFDLNKADLSWGDGFHETMQRTGFTYAQDSEGKMDTIWAYAGGTPGPYGAMLQREGWAEAHKEDMLTRGHSDRPTPLPDDLYADNWITRQGLRMLAGVPQNQPWFMQVNFSGPHDPWDITQAMKDRVKDRIFPDAVNCPFPEENQKVRQNYAAMIENIDNSIGLFLEQLREQGMLDNTIVIYSSDHGEMMGDHGMYGKAKPEQGSIHIPLVVDASRFGGRQGAENNSPVELQDLAATILDYAQVPPLGGKGSVSIRPIVEGRSQQVRDYAVSELVNLVPGGAATAFYAITDGTYKLILRSGEPDRLYNLDQDPFEQENLAASMPEVVRTLRSAIPAQQERNPIIAEYAKKFPIST